jgi:hypothetical protein
MSIFKEIEKDFNLEDVILNEKDQKFMDNLKTKLENGKIQEADYNLAKSAILTKYKKEEKNIKSYEKKTSDKKIDVKKNIPEEKIKMEEKKEKETVSSKNIVQENKELEKKNQEIIKTEETVEVVKEEVKIETEKKEEKVETEEKNEIIEVKKKFTIFDENIINHIKNDDYKNIKIEEKELNEKDSQFYERIKSKLEKGLISEHDFDIAKQALLSKIHRTENLKEEEKETLLLSPRKVFHHIEEKLISPRKEHHENNSLWSKDFVRKFHNLRNQK